MLLLIYFIFSSFVTTHLNVTNEKKGINLTTLSNKYIIDTIRDR